MKTIKAVFLTDNIFAFKCKEFTDFPKPIFNSCGFIDDKFKNTHSKTGAKHHLEDRGSIHDRLRKSKKKRRKDSKNKLSN